MKIFKIAVLFIIFIVVGWLGAMRIVTLNNRSMEYFSFGSPQLIIQKGPEGSFDCKRAHTLSIVELNKNGYRFWGYYTGWDGINFKNDMGLTYSNDLVHWVKASSRPVISNLRWATAFVADGVIHLYGTRNYGGNSYISHFTSKDGKNFTEHEAVAGPVDGERHQNPYAFYDENTATYRLYYFHAQGNNNYLEEKHSKNVEQLAGAKANKVMDSKTDILAAPSIVYRDGKYWLTAETLINPNTAPKWETLAYVSDNPVKGFVPAKNKRILIDDDACLFQYVFDNRLNAVYSHRYSDDTWEMYNRVYDFKNRTSVEISDAGPNLKKGGIKQLSASIKHSNGKSAEVTSKATWATSDNNVVTVRKGKITALSEGTATITVSYGGASKTANVTVMK